MNDELKFYPPKYKNTYKAWLEEIQDWCISRQLWWGHRIPAYFLPTDEDNEKSNRAILFTHVVSMAQKLGIECIAEGVETVQQAEILRTNNCRYAQGFLYDRPLPVAQFEDKLNNHKYNV